MKYLSLLALILVMLSCKKEQDVKMVGDYASYGKEITADGALSKEDMLAKYKALKVGDTINVKFASKVNSACKMKGCWMNLELGQDQESFVKFKDYDFFVPKDFAGAEAIVEGRAFLSETSVDDLKEYAKDDGKSQEEIDAITEPKVEYGFLADGVLGK